MTRTEHLLTIIAEECAEIAQQASKALRFGLHEIEPGGAQSHGERIVAEFADLVSALEMLSDETQLWFNPTSSAFRFVVAGKKGKVENYFDFSRKRGTLTDEHRE